MRKLFLYSSFLILYLFVSINLTVESRTIPLWWNADSIVAMWQAKRLTCPREYVYLQLNKDIYETGEDLFFKASLFQFPTLEYSNQSKTLYLQLLNSMDSVVWQAKYPIEKGRATGHIYLSTELPEDNYYLESYTRYSFYDDSLSLLQRKRIKVVKNVVGISGNQEIVPLKVEELTLLHTGVEKQPTEVSFCYRGRNRHFLGFRLSCQDSVASRNLLVVAQMYGTPCYMAKVHMKGEQDVNIPLSVFPGQGVASILFYGETMHPLWQKQVYVHHEKRLYIQMKTDCPDYSSRDKVTVRVKVTNEKGIPVRADLGISVFDRFYEEKMRPINMLAECYLVSQFTDSLYNPRRYYETPFYENMFCIDSLLQQLSANKYIWNYDRAYNCYSPFLAEELQGVLESNRKATVRRLREQPEQMVRVFNANGSSQLFMTDSSACLRINAEEMRKMRGGYIYLQPLMGEDYKPYISFCDEFKRINEIRKRKSKSDAWTDVRQTSNFTAAYEKPVVNKDSSVLLDEVAVSALKIARFRDKFMGRLDSLANMDLNHLFVCSKCGYLVDYYSGYVGHHENPDSRSRCKGEHLIPEVGKRYEMVKFEYRKEGTSGMAFKVVDRKMIIYHKNLYTEDELLKINNIYRVKGYEGIYNFHHVDDLEVATSTPDARNALFWSPSIRTDERGEAEFSFYCSDINSEYIIRVEGSDGKGLIGCGESFFNVYRNRK